MGKKENTENYSFDIEKIFNWVFSDEGNNSDTQITETFTRDEGESMELIERQVNEVKSRTDSTKPTIKYDFIKMCIGELNNVNNVDNNRSLGSLLIENTLIENKMIKCKN